MIKIHPIPFNNYYFPEVADQFFDYEFGKNMWYWSSADQADFFATMSGIESINKVKRDKWREYSKPILHFHIQHYSDGQDFYDWAEQLDPNAYIVGELMIKKTHPKYIFSQFSQNVVKSYARNFQFTFPFGKFYYKDLEAFNKINKNFNPDNKTKIFISVNKTHPNSYRSCSVRKEIINLVYNKFRHLGHIGNKDGLGLWLADNTFNATTIDELYLQTQDPKATIAFGHNYPHILYFQDTFISFYGETYEGEFGNGAYGVTEKTWIPMMQGHFILPFGAQGIIGFLKTLGFKFPEEINYSYDTYENYHTRMKIYLEEINRLCMLPLNTWKDIYRKNVDILKHNQSLMLDAPIHKCDLLKKIGIERN